MKNIKKYLFFVSLSFVVLFLSFLPNIKSEVNFAFALEINYPPMLGITVTDQSTFAEFANYFFNLGMTLAVSLAMLVIIIGGIHWLVSFGMGKITSEGKEWVKAGILGLLLLLCSYLIAVTINPQLIHFALKDLIPIPPFGGGGGDNGYPPQLPTITYREIPIGTLTENLLSKTMDCYEFDKYGDPIDGDLTTDILEPTFKNHDRVDCLLKLAEATERKTENFKKLSEQLASLMEECSCKDPSTSGSTGYSSENGLVKNIFLKNNEYDFESKIFGVLLASEDFTTDSYTQPTGELYNATNITAASANLEGKIIDDGGGDCWFRFKWKKTTDSQWQEGQWYGSFRTGNNFSMNIANLEQNTSYEFTVEVKNAAQSSGYLPSKTFRTPLLTKPAAELSDATNITATSATLNGKITNDGGDACQYQFKWRKAGDSEWTLGGWNGSLRTGANFNQDISGLEPNTSYEFTAEVKNNVGSSGVLTPKTFTTPSATGLGCEVYSAGNITTTSANLIGKVIGDGGEYCQYQFKWRKAGDSEWTLGGWNGSLRTGNIFNQSLSGLAANTTYNFLAEIKNSGETVVCVFKKLGPPLGLNAVALNTTQVFVSWVKGYGAENTIVRRDKDKCPEKPTDGVLVYSGPTESFVDTGLTQNSVYCYVAWSTLGTIYSDPSNPAYVTTEKASTCLTTECPGCSRGWTRKTPCPENSPCPEKCPACGCPSEKPDCSPCPPGVKNIIDHGPIILEDCAESKNYKGLDEFRSQHTNILDVVEIEVTIKEEKVKIIKKDVWDELRLIDQLKYLKEKIKTIKTYIEGDLNNLESAESALSQCYYSKPYVELLKLIEQTNQEKLIIRKEKTFEDPATNDYIDISKYCLGFNYANSQCYHTCQNICPGINTDSLNALRVCPINSQHLASGDLTQGEINCLKNAFHKCPSNTAFGIFDNCLTDCKNQCSQICEQKYRSCSEESEKCKEKCNDDSACLLNNEEKCYISFPALKRCADAFGNFDDFKKCAETAFQCKYCSSQHAGYPDCLKTIEEDYSFSFLFENPDLKCPECYDETATEANSCVKLFPEAYKCPPCSLCPECPCENIIEPGVSYIYGLSSAECGEFAYNDDPLTFYCRTDWWNEIEEKAKTPIGNEKICPKQNEIPVGQTVDEAEAWAKELLKQIDDFVGKTENMIEYIKEIGEEENYCKCNSICQPGELTCKIECEYKTTEVEYQDPETGEMVHYYVCYCLRHSCDGNPCQKIINMLRGKAANDKCPKGTEYKGVAWHYNQIRRVFEKFDIIREGRSEGLKKLVYSRKKIDECSATAKLFEKEIKLLNCKRVEDQIMAPIIYGEVIIREESLERHCYGKRAGEVLKIAEPLLDNWFCCERRLK